MEMDDRIIRSQFRKGLYFVLVVQTLFMAGGLLVERLLKAPVTGVPSLIGLTVVLFVCALKTRDRGPFFLLGSFSIAFLAPAALFLVTYFKAFPVQERLAYYSMGYMSALVMAVWIYFGVRILQKDLG